MEPFALAEDVQRRLDFVLDNMEETAVNASLEDMSNLARFHAERDWPYAEDAPYIIRVTVLQAVVRWARNMHGYTISRAGDEALSWTDLGERAGAPFFTNDEIKLIRAVGSGRRTPFIGSVEVFSQLKPGESWDGTLPVTGGHDPFPFYNPLQDGW